MIKEALNGQLICKWLTKLLTYSQVSIWGHDYPIVGQSDLPPPLLMGIPRYAYMLMEKPSPSLQVGVAGFPSL